MRGGIVSLPTRQSQRNFAQAKNRRQWQKRRAFTTDLKPKVEGLSKTRVVGPEKLLLDFDESRVEAIRFVLLVLWIRVVRHERRGQDDEEVSAATSSSSCPTLMWWHHT